MFLVSEDKKDKAVELRSLGMRYYREAIPDFDWSVVSEREFMIGLGVELEHGTKAGPANVTGDDPVLTAKIALAHISEIRDYYTRLMRMENDAKEGKEASDENSEK